METYKELLSPNISAKEIETRAWPDFTNSSIEHFYNAIWKLCHEISKPKRVGYVTEQLSTQDKNEEYTVSLWSLFAPCFHDIDTKRSSLYVR